MTITLTSKEFDEAISLWLEDQGFSTDRYSISTRTIAGRSDGPLGTRIEATLEPKPTTPVFEAMNLSAMDVQIATGVTPSFSQRASQGHADE